MQTMLRCEVIGVPRGDGHGQGRTDGGRRPRRRARRFSDKCKKVLRRCMSGGTARGRKARAGKCLRKLHRCEKGRR